MELAYFQQLKLVRLNNKITSQKWQYHFNATLREQVARVRIELVLLRKLTERNLLALTAQISPYNSFNRAIEKR